MGLMLTTKQALKDTLLLCTTEVEDKGGNSASASKL